MKDNINQWGLSIKFVIAKIISANFLLGQKKVSSFNEASSKLRRKITNIRSKHGYLAICRTKWVFVLSKFSNSLVLRATPFLERDSVVSKIQNPILSNFSKGYKFNLASWTTLSSHDFPESMLHFPGVANLHYTGTCTIYGMFAHNYRIVKL